jgi:predicted Zn-dependent protease
MLGTSERSGYAALAAMLLGLLAGVVARSGDLGMGIAMSGQAFAVDSQLRFSRSAEHEADRVGFQMLSAAGYDPYAMATFFERLDRSAMGDAGVPPYARTHPLTGERIADMEDRARRVPYRQPRQSSEYGFVRARARVLQVNSASDYRDIVSRLRAEIDDQTALNAAANWYGIALAETLLGDYGPAGESLATSRRLFEGEMANAAQAASEVKNEDAQTRSLSPEPATNAAIRITSAKPIKPTSIAPASRSSPSLDVLAAEIARRAGRADEAVRLADTAQRRWPASHAAIETHLRALLSAQRFDDARTLARAETRADPAQPDWWRYLAEACVGANDPLEQHRAMAEKFALDGAWPSAIRQLKEARDVKSANFYDLSTISARLRDFESRYKEEREQEKDGGFS